MCGIYGVVGYPTERAERILNALAIFMHHRGPDGEGRHLEPGIAMGMRRLAIIDLQHGWQPFCSTDGQVICFQNGEIYNHRDLRRELEACGVFFKTASDTEVLLHGYLHWGLDELLKRLDGMYAIAILDRSKGELMLARDRFGEKPLFYTWIGDRFAYSSDLLTLAALPDQDRSIDTLSLERYLALHYVPGRRTIFRVIQRLLPGELMRIRVRDVALIEQRCYFNQTLGETRVIPDAELSELIERAITSRLVADVPVGVFLSGGLDSSIVAALAARLNPEIATFSMGFTSAQHDESPFAQAVAQHIGSRHHHFIFRSDDFTELLPKVAHALDEPVGDQALLPLYWLCREAATHVRVVLSGEGADELFAGYGYYQTFTQSFGLMALWQRFHRHHLSLPHLETLIHNCQPISPSGFPLLADPATRQMLLEPGLQGQSSDAWETGLIGWLDTARDPLCRATAADLATWLPDDLLVKFDRMTMAHSLEGRAPFLNPALVDAALHLPPNQRQTRHRTKIALRRIARRWLPPLILKRRKQGFVLPMRRWLGDWFRQCNGIENYLATRELPGLSKPALSSYLSAQQAQGFPNERLVFALILLLEWSQSARSRINALSKAMISG